MQGTQGMLSSSSYDSYSDYVHCESRGSGKSCLNRTVIRQGDHMKLIRHYYISDDLDDLEVLEQELENRGILTPQIHILTHANAEVDHHHHLHDVNSFMKKDVVHSAEIGAAIGVVLAAILLAVVHFTGLGETPAGWVPWIFLSIVILGFCTWEGGLFGIQVPNVHFKRFGEALDQGKHVFFVDLEPSQEDLVAEIVNAHPKLNDAGTTGSYTPRWLIKGQQRVKNFIQSMP